MARKCTCDALMDSEFVRHRLLLVSAAARWIWLSLAKAMMVSDEPGVLRFGSGLGLFALVSRLVSVSETEAETELENLIAVGLLLRRDQDEIALPDLAPARSRRAEAARINGLKGGRPAKSQQDRSQRTMPLVLPGGRSDASAETHGGGSVSRTAAAAKAVQEASSSDGKPKAAEPADVDAIGREAAEAAGLDHAAGFHSWGIVGQWLAAGATRELILDVIESRHGVSVRSLRYFDAPVRAAIAAAKPAASRAGMPEAERQARSDWRRDISAWQDGGQRGRMPVLAEYLARAGGAQAAPGIARPVVSAALDQAQAGVSRLVGPAVTEPAEIGAMQGSADDAMFGAVALRPGGAGKQAVAA